MANIFDSIDLEELKKNAERILEITGKGARKVCNKAKDDYEEMNPDVKRAIILGESVFAIIVVVAGCFYLLGKRAGRKEQMDVEYEEWDA